MLLFLGRAPGARSGYYWNYETCIIPNCRRFWRVNVICGIAIAYGVVRRKKGGNGYWVRGSKNGAVDSEHGAHKARAGVRSYVQRATIPRKRGVWIYVYWTFIKHSTHPIINISISCLVQKENTFSPLQVKIIHETDIQIMHLFLAQWSGRLRTCMLMWEWSRMSSLYSIHRAAIFASQIFLHV